MKTRFIRTTAFAIAVFFFVASALSVGRVAASRQQSKPDPQAKPQLTKPQHSTQRESEPQDRESKDDKIRIGTDLVVLDVTVVDQSSNPVLDLKQDQFQVFEDKVQQKVEFFSREQVPVSLVFTIDTSGSMRQKIDTVIKASTNLVKESRQGDEMAVIEFKDTPELLEEFTTDVNDTIDTLQGLSVSGQTAMLDALYLAGDYANKEGKNRRKAVVVVTDGLDKDSYYKFNEVVSHLREVDVQIYLIGFTGDLEKDGNIFKKSSKAKAEELLSKLAEETGGKAFFPRELSEVHTIAQQISTDLRTQYAIGYYPTNSKRDGTFRSVKVQVNAGSNRRIVARTRAGYTAPREGEQSKSGSN